MNESLESIPTGETFARTYHTVVERNHFIHDLRKRGFTYQRIYQTMQAFGEALTYTGIIRIVNIIESDLAQAAEYRAVSNGEPKSGGCVPPGIRGWGQPCYYSSVRG